MAFYCTPARIRPVLEKAKLRVFLIKITVFKEGFTLYQYFIQPIINKYNQSVISYELLLRQQDKTFWGPVDNFSTVPAHVIVDELIEVAKQLAQKVPFISVNLNRAQLLNPDIIESLIQAQKRLRPVQIQIELTEDVVDIDFSDNDIIAVLQQFINEEMSISIDDVDCGCNTEAFVKKLIPFTHEIKFALQNFGQSVFLPEIQQRMLYWRNFAKLHKVRFILEGIENEKIDEFIDRFNIDIRQGYFYEKPHPLHLNKAISI